MTIAARQTKLLRGWTSPNLEEFKYPHFVSGEGIYVHDADGRAYLDGKGMMINVAFGHGIPSIAQAAAEQLAKMPYLPTMDSHANAPADELARRLVELAPPHLGRAYLSTSGTAACEVALMMTRAYWRLRKKPEKTFIVALDRGYHGQSLAMTAVSGFESVRADFGPLLREVSHVPPAYCHRCPYGLEPQTCAQECASAFEERVQAIGPERVAAIIVEPVVGAVVQPPPPRYFEALRECCEKHDIVLIADEVITAFGRTGAHFASTRFGLEPDFVCLGKAITNGALPLAATLVATKIWDAFREADHELYFGSTQDGNPTCAAAALAVLDLYASDDWPRRAAATGEHLLGRLRAAATDVAIVSDVRGVGLFLAVELSDPETHEPLDAASFAPAFLDAGLLVHLEGNIVILSPPLCLTTAEAEELVTRLMTALASTDSENKQ